jgi:hypothetical protein
MAVNITVWDITKSVAAIAIVIFIMYYGKTFIDNMAPSKDIPPAVLIQLDANKVMLQNLVENDKAAKALIKQMQDEKGQQAEFLKYVMAENKKKNAQLEEVGVTVAKLDRTVTKLREDATVAKVAPKTGDAPEDLRRDKLAYEMKEIYSKDAKGNDLPIAWAMYFPNQDPDKKWKTGSYPLEFYTTVVESENKDGSFSRAAEAHIENNATKESKGKEYPIKITDFKWEKFERKDKSFSWWNPRLGLGLTATAKDIAPKLDFSIASYGKTAVDMDWRFLTFGVGAVQGGSNSSWKTIGSFEPFSWNVGKALPLIKNMFIAPTVTYDSDAELSIGAGISIPF